MIHSFNDSIQVSQQQSGAPWWEQCYRKAFPTFASMGYVANDGWAQRGGIDRVVNHYGDILLEYWSNESRKTPGWIAKDLACDYIAYAIIPTRKCYLLPFHTLRLAWKENRNEWVKTYPEIRAQNNTYVTVSVGIPVDVLFTAINNAMLVQWE